MTLTRAGARDRFEIPALPTRTIFGPGTRALTGDALDRAGIDRVLVVCTPRSREAISDVLGSLGNRVVDVFTEARTHVPRATVDSARAAVARSRPGGCLAVGGGSAIGLAKMLALEPGLPFIALPTTYAGSEMTSIWGTTEHGVKTTGRDDRVRPKAVICDPELSVSLPEGTSTTSGLNALAHAVEALYAPDGSPVTDIFALEGIATVAGALRTIQVDSHDLPARSSLLYGAALCGMCLGMTSMSLHHKIAHVLGGSFDLPHAETHATVLPYVLAFNLPAVPEVAAQLSEALGGRDPAVAVWSLGTAGGEPRSLAALGLRVEDLPRAADLVMKALGAPQSNPRPVGLEDLDRLLRRALEGTTPTCDPADLAWWV